MDHVGHAFATNRANGEVHVLQAEGVGRDPFQRETRRRKLRERKLARLVDVSASALDGDEIDSDFIQR